MSLHDKALIGKGLEALRAAHAEGNSLDNWRGAEQYAQVIAAISDRVSPLSERSSGDGYLEFSINRVGKSRSVLIHRHFVDVVNTERKIIEQFQKFDEEVTSEKDIPDGWPGSLAEADETPEDVLEILADMYGVETTDELPHYWHAPRHILERLEEESDPKTKNTYTIYFSLNVIPKSRARLPQGIPLPQGFLAPTTRNNLEDIIANAQNKPTPQLNGEMMSDAYFTKHELSSKSEASFWQFKCDATSIAGASQIFRGVIAAIAGTMNYVENQETGVAIDFETTESDSLDSRRIVQVPQYHLITQNSKYVGYGTSEEGRPGHPLRLGDQERDTFEDIMHIARVDADIADAWRGAFEAYYEANSASTSRHEFLSLWQALEALTMTGNGDNSKEVLKRCKGFMQRASKRDQSSSGHPTFIDSELFEVRLPELKDRRNHFVHGGERTEILAHDSDTLRYTFSVMVDAIQELVRDDRDGTEIEGIFAFGTCDDLRDDISEYKKKLKQVRAGDEWSLHDA